MVDTRFSLEAFELLRGNPAAVRTLADVLQEEVLQELQSVVEKRFLELVEMLRQLGHDLRPLKPVTSGEIHYRDDSRDDTGYDCKLRLASDLTISAGFADVRFSKSRPDS